MKHVIKMQPRQTSDKKVVVLPLSNQPHCLLLFFVTDPADKLTFQQIKTIGWVTQSEMHLHSCWPQQLTNCQASSTHQARNGTKHCSLMSSSLVDHKQTTSENPQIKSRQWGAEAISKIVNTTHII